MTVAIIVPVLRRPHKVAPLVDSIVAADPRALILFVCSPGDTAQAQRVVFAASREPRVLAPMMMPDPPGRGDYARKVNHAVAYLSQPEFGLDWFLMGADDIAFHPGWFDACLAASAAHDAERGAGVVGTNDLGNETVMRGAHSTHPLVSRTYIEEWGGVADEPPGIMLNEAYWHNYCDTELVATAKLRDAWVFARDAHVEHLHPFWKKGEEDGVYRIGQEHYHDDRRLFQKRVRTVIR